MTIRLGRHELGLEEATVGREWLLTNGLGGFASSTVAGLNTRRYHGWLVAQVRRHGGRFVVLAKLEEEVRVGGQVWALSTDRFTGGTGTADTGDGPGQGAAVVARSGYRRLHAFSLDPLPRFTYHLDGLFIERSLFMVRGANRTVVTYRYLGSALSRRARAGDGPDSGRPALSLRLRPLVTFRFYHHLLRANDWPFTTEAGPGWVTVRPHDDSPFLVLRSEPSRSGQGAWSSDGRWQYGFDYLEEQRRGLDHVEDLYSPGYLTFGDLHPGDAVAVVADLAETEAEAERLRGESLPPRETARWRTREEERLEDLLREARSRVRRASSGASGAPGREPLPSLFDRLVLATDAFVVERGDGPSRRATVIAGYPWFEDWGRDTLVALPGLLLVTGRTQEAFRVLRDQASFACQGLLPNRFPDQASRPDYNTVDASLWLFWAVQAYLAWTGDRTGVREHLARALREIAGHYRRGTNYAIKAGPDGLLHAGEPGVAVTWMDAKLGDWVVTPRVGYPVEVNALWYNALRFLAELDEEAGGAGNGPEDGGDPGEGGWGGVAARVKAAFNARFWNEDRGCLYDVIQDPGTGRPPDPSVRPNQLLAVSLPYPVLEPSRWRAVVEVCLLELHTPLGLRTLSPGDPAYRPAYRGGPAERDAAYHQGTAWPWLMGPFLTALRRAAEPDGGGAGAAMAARLLQPFEGHLHEAGIGYVSEVFDGDFPHSPGGCIAQAWSVAEVLRAYVEEVLGLGPRGDGRGGDGHASSHA